MSDAELTRALSEPVIGYSISYPFGVIGVILGFFLYKKIFKINVSEEAKNIEIKMGLGGEELQNVRVKVTEEKLFGWNVKEIFKAKELSGVIISRIQKHNSEHEDIVSGNTILEKDDILTLVGIPQEIEKDCAIFGEKITELESSHKNDDLDYRRILVSHPDVIGVPLGELNLHAKFKATITRIKRGDVDFVPKEDTRLQAGDRIRIVASRDDLKLVAKYFGDSFSSISHIDYISMSIGIALGLLIGSIPFPLPGGEHFKLGFAGGPLVVALILGKIGRSGKIIWTMSYNANLTVNQLGVVLFLAGIGLKAGFSFGENVKAYGLILLSMGIIITTFSTFLMLFIGRKFLKIPYPLLTGIISGMQTQPATLAYSNDEVKNSAPNLGYAMVFPTAMIMKIILVRIIFKFLG
jgi:putative transport protein